MCERNRILRFVLQYALDLMLFLFHVRIEIIEKRMKANEWIIWLYWVGWTVEIGCNQTNDNVGNGRSRLSSYSYSFREWEKCGFL